MKLKPTIELIALALRHRKRLGRCDDALPDLVDDPETIRDRQLEDLIQRGSRHSRSVLRSPV
jgi:hypothetical protein